MRRVASTPSQIGIRRSIKTTSARGAERDGLLTIARGTDDGEAVDEPEEGDEALPHRRLVVGDHDADRILLRVRHAGHPQLDLPAAISRAGAEGPTDQRGALAHPGDAVAAARHRLRPVPRKRLVLHAEHYGSLVEGEGDGDARALGVLADVRQRLLRDASAGEVGVRRQRSRHPLERVVRGCVVVAAVVVDEQRDERGERLRVAAQRGHGLARLVDPLDDQPLRPLDLCERSGGVVLLGEQRLRDLELHRERGERVGEHVVDLARKPHALVERGGARPLLLRPLRLRQQQLRLLDTFALLAPREPGEEPDGGDGNGQRVVLARARRDRRTHEQRADARPPPRASACGHGCRSAVAATASSARTNAARVWPPEPTASADGERDRDGRKQRHGPTDATERPCRPRGGRKDEARDEDDPAGAHRRRRRPHDHADDHERADHESRAAGLRVVPPEISQHHAATVMRRSARRHPATG